MVNSQMDKKDAIMNELAGQRNKALDQLASCAADNYFLSEENADLRRRISELELQINTNAQV